MLSNFHLLSEQEYQDLRHDLMVDVEVDGTDPELEPYLDSKGIPTIGVGFNLRDGTVRNKVLEALGVTPLGLTGAAEAAELAYIDQLAAEIASSHTDNTALQADLDAIMATRAADVEVTHTGKRTTFDFADAGVVRTVFDSLAESVYEGTVDTWLGGIPDSQERAALFSLGWNQSSQNPLLGSGLEAAIEAGDRAEAWFEIRYRSNGDELDGIAKRRYYESQIFDLYDDPDGKSDEELDSEYRLVFRMLTKHAVRIESYDNTYGAQVGDANTDYTLVGLDVESTEDATQQAKDFLIQLHATLDQEIKDELEAAQVPSALLTLHEEIGGVFVAPNVQWGGEEKQFTVDRTDASAADQDDLIFGESHSDTLLGGDGNDLFVGGLGSDTITGGEGEDTISFARSSLGVTVDQAQGTGVGGDAQGDKITEVENVIGSKHNDTLAGDEQKNVLLGLKGDDSLSGGGGNDVIIGGEGNDTIDGGPGWDTGYGGVGNDVILSIEEGDPNTEQQGGFYWGGEGNDTLYGGGDGDVLYGGEGDDHLEHSGFGKIDGGVGNDILKVKDPILGPDDQGLVIDGSAGDDEITVRGGQGSFIFGGAGDDEIDVWSRGTQIHGGDGEDLFSWSPNTIVHDAEAHDRIEIFNIPLRGGVAFGGEDSDWANSTLFPFIRYGVNFQGDLVINYDRENFLPPDLMAGPMSIFQPWESP